jgi:hypothetical protein
MYVWFHTLQEEVCSKRKACLYVWYVCFTLQLELEMKTTKRSDASGIASPSWHNLLHNMYTFSSLFPHPPNPHPHNSKKPHGGWWGLGFRWWVIFRTLTKNGKFLQWSTSNCSTELIMRFANIQKPSCRKQACDLHTSSTLCRCNRWPIPLD